MKNRRAIWIISVISMLIVTVLSNFGCAVNQPVTPTAVTTTVIETTTAKVVTFPITIIDQLGRLVEIDKMPQRIVSIAPANTQILYSLGELDKVVGVTNVDNYPPEVTSKTIIGSFSTPDIEKIVAIAPDLVLAAPLQQKSIIPQLEAKGLTVFATGPTTIDGIMQAVSMIGEITGASAEATQVVSDMQSRIKAITDKTSKLPDSQKPKVFDVIWSDPLTTAGAGTFTDDLISLAGGINITHDLSGYPKISLETVVAANPDIIIAQTNMGSGGDTTLVFAQTEPRLSGTNALQHNQVFSIGNDVSGVAAPRIVDALEQFAEYIHPELFGNAK